MRLEKLYLTDIIEACQSIELFCMGISFNQFHEDDMRRSAVLHKLIVIGEAAAHLSEEFTNNHANIPWMDVINFRNFAVHAYFSVKWEIVWVTVTEEVPILRQQVTTILKDYLE